VASPGPAYEELRRLADAGASAPTEENLAAVRLSSAELDAFSLWDALDTMERTVPAMTGIPHELLRGSAAIGMPYDSLVGLLATHTAVGLMLGLQLAKVRRG
jgi:hypothetical protein